MKDDLVHICWVEDLWTWEQIDPLSRFATHTINRETWEEFLTADRKFGKMLVEVTERAERIIND